MNVIKGKTSEYIAKQHLVRRGYEYIDSNVYFDVGEIDLIFRSHDMFIFVEVKSLHKKNNLNIYETLTTSKIRKIERSILKWLSRMGYEAFVWRFDFIGIIYSRDMYWIDHIENVELK